MTTPHGRLEGNEWRSVCSFQGNECSLPPSFGVTEPERDRERLDGKGAQNDLRVDLMTPAKPKGNQEPSSRRRGHTLSCGYVRTHSHKTARSDPRFRALPFSHGIIIQVPFRCPYWVVVCWMDGWMPAATAKLSWSQLACECGCGRKIRDPTNTIIAAVRILKPCWWWRYPPTWLLLRFSTATKSSCRYPSWSHNRKIWSSTEPQNSRYPTRRDQLLCRARSIRLNWTNNNWNPWRSSTQENLLVLDPHPFYW